MTDRYPLLMSPARKARAREWEAQEAARIEAVVRKCVAVYVDAELEAVARMVEGADYRSDLPALIRARITGGAVQELPKPDARVPVKLEIAKG